MPQQLAEEPIPKRKKVRRSFTPAERVTNFWAKVLIGEECWLWQGGRTERGYGNFSTGDRMTGAHRFSLELELGRRLERHEHACHTCDNPPCVRPSHLFVGSARDNAMDSIAKGRRAGPNRSVPVELRKVVSRPKAA